jgi:hypothetical protein
MMSVISRIWMFCLPCEAELSFLSYDHKSSDAGVNDVVLVFDRIDASTSVVVGGMGGGCSNTSRLVHHDSENLLNISA